VRSGGGNQIGAERGVGEGGPERAKGERIQRRSLREDQGKYSRIGSATDAGGTREEMRAQVR